ncbi:MAG: hypothetical protein PF541_18930 [Prolixibacteraceae bacterium]|jgi:hypothetical protein|nr:hypothetical protein [Prolixibacteraceae bacterium]
MKRVVVIIPFLLFAILLFSQVQMSEKVTDKWPYLYEEFQEGFLYFDGNKISDGSFNIDIANQTLIFYGEDNLLKSVDESVTIDSLVLIDSKYYRNDNTFYEVISQDGTLALLKKTRVDLNALNDTGGGYGTSSATDAKTKLTSVDVSNYTGVAYEVVKLEKGKGKLFDIITGYYLVDLSNEDYQRATKRAFSKAFPNTDVKKIARANKIRFNNESHLQLIFSKCVN